MTDVDRFADIERMDAVRTAGPHLWHTLGYRRTALRSGTTTIEWDADEAYCFPSAGGPIVQGGMVTALLDAAMGGACWSVLDADQTFLTADLRVEFLRSCRPSTLRAVGEVVRRTRRVVFCSAQLFDAAGVVLAASRCTQVVLPADGRAARQAAEPETDGAASG
ncbi:MAG TPA: PaaI family thioesterase [Pseudonocardiaceae bacterium]|nr:PaaI family thioesterase [Pseudonocardiaceae bacterium]